MGYECLVYRIERAYERSRKKKIQKTQTKIIHILTPEQGRVDPGI